MNNYPIEMLRGNEAKIIKNDRNITPGIQKVFLLINHLMLQNQ